MAIKLDISGLQSPRWVAWIHRTTQINSFTRMNGFRISNGQFEKANAEIRKLIKVSYGCSNFILNIFFQNNSIIPFPCTFIF